MKYLKYIALMLFAVLSAACESLPLPIADITVQKQGVVALGSNSATLEIVFAPTAATIQSVVACYSTNSDMSNAEECAMECSDILTYTVKLTGLQKNTTYYVHYKVSNAISACRIVDQFTTKEGTNIPSDTNNNYEYVDLGLSVKWATCNVGATKPEEYGDYFAWGEIEPKEVYNWSTYKWCNGSSSSLTKYCTSSSYGIVDNKTTLELSDDAAAMNWGGNWRMPTDSEMTELREQCIWTWITQNGVKGYIVTSKSNGNSIFLPAAGCREGSSFIIDGSSNGEHGHYWSSSVDWFLAYRLYFYKGSVNRGSNGRCYGQSVRPVYDAQVEDTNKETYFSVSATKKVTFSPGNLQYHPANNEWRFAENQTDYIGDANSHCSSTYNGWLDLFGWSTSANSFGVSTSTNDNDYTGSFVDWGTNQIGADAPNTWRTLTNDEWNYLLNTRTNASSLKGVAQLDGVNGLILLPDNWTCPSGVTFKSGFHSSNGDDYYAAYQTFTADQWTRLEIAGAVFLPASGTRDGSNVNYVQIYGYCWSATKYYSDYADILYFISGEASVSYNYRYSGKSVRLVKDL